MGRSGRWASAAVRASIKRSAASTERAHEDDPRLCAPRRGIAAAVIRELEKMPEVEEVSSVSGPYDYLIFLRCETHEQLDELLDRIGLIDGVKQTQTSIVLSRKVDRRSAVGAP